ncbi:MAG TPA: hypothetical protein VHZ52_12080 [Acidobacteriaceae bacterium]|jgi:hypothetical protein|nr:hypothetical protein [Acidobacteriaceae bacterium]
MKMSVPTPESPIDSSHNWMPELSARAIACLQPLADRYVWWKPSEEAMLYPNRVVAQVMNLGTFDDVTELVEVVGEDYLREVLIQAEAGQFNERSWHYWHYRLGLADYGKIPVPPMPARKIA